MPRASEKPLFIRDYNGRTDWSEANLATLKTMHAAGKSAQQIGDTIGATRSSVIGKLHRLGLGGTVQKPKLNNRIRLANGRARAKAKGPPPLRVVGSAGHVDAPAPDRALVSFAALTAHSCRWPYGDPQRPDFGYCGAACEGDHPYCGEHVRAAYEPSKKRERRSRELTHLSRLVGSARIG